MAAASTACPHPGPQLSEQQVVPWRMRILLISVASALGRLRGKCRRMISVDFPIITFSLFSTGFPLIVLYSVIKIFFVFSPGFVQVLSQHQWLSSILPLLLYLCLLHPSVLPKKLGLIFLYTFLLSFNSVDIKSIYSEGVALNPELSSFILFSCL